MHLGTKTTIILTAIVTAAIIPVSVLLLHYQEESLKQIILKGVDSQAKIAVSGIDSFISEGLREALAISVTLPVEALLQGRNGEVETHLKRLYETFPNFQNGIFILDKDGKFLADYPSHPELRGQSFAFRDYYQRSVNEKRGVIGKPYKSARSG